MKRKKSEGEQPELRAQPAAVAPVAKTTPGNGVSTWEYTHAESGEIWRVERVDLLLAEFPGLLRERLAAIQRILELPEHARSWMVVRRLFGCMPLKVPLGGDPEDYRVWTRGELREVLGLEERAIRAELDVVRGIVGRKTEDGKTEDGGRRTEDGKGGAASGFQIPTSEPRLLETDEEVLRRYQFPVSIFQKEGRAKEENLAELGWFAGRVREWERLFKAAMTNRAATQALYSELRLRRAEMDSWELERRETPLEPTQRGAMETLRKKISDRISDLESTYRAQLEALQELAPWFNVTGKQMSVTGAVGEMIKACQEWEAQGSRELVDGVFTALEIEVQLRTHTLAPEPMYRLGWLTHVIDSKRWMWNPTASARFKPKDLEVLDHAFKAAVRAYKELHQLPVPDLLDDGPGGEFEVLGKAES